MFDDLETMQAIVKEALGPLLLYHIPIDVIQEIVNGKAAYTIYDVRIYYDAYLPHVTKKTRVFKGPEVANLNPITYITIIYGLPMIETIKNNPVDMALVQEIMTTCNLSYNNLFVRSVTREISYFELMGIDPKTIGPEAFEILEQSIADYRAGKVDPNEDFSTYKGFFSKAKDQK